VWCQPRTTGHLSVPRMIGLFRQKIPMCSCKLQGTAPGAPAGAWPMGQVDLASIARAAV